jgi:TP901 family phage tail tape measure protein
MADTLTIRELVTRWKLNADTEQVKAFQKGIESAKKAAKVASAAILAMGAASVKMAADFETAFSEVLTLVDFNAEQTEALRQQILGLAKDTGQLPTDVAKAFYATFSAGFADVAKSSEVMRVALDLAKGGVTSTENATKGLVSILNAYGYSAQQSEAVSDALFVAMRAGQTTIGELAESLGTVSPVAANVGVSLEEVLAAVSALTKGGIGTKVAVTGLRAVMAAVLKPSAEATKTAKELGIRFDAAALSSMGLADFLQMVGAAVDGNNEKLAVLFGGIEALVPIMALVNKQSGDFSSILDQMANRAGTTAAAVAKMENTTSHRFDQMKARFATLAIEVGSKLLPVVNKLLESISSIADAFSGNEAAINAFIGLMKVIIGMKLVSYFHGLAQAIAGAAGAIAGGGAAGAAGGAGKVAGGLLGATSALTVATFGLGAAIVYTAARYDELVESGSNFFNVIAKGINRFNVWRGAKPIFPEAPDFSGNRKTPWVGDAGTAAGGIAGAAPADKPRQRTIGFTPAEVSELMALGTGRGAPTLRAADIARLGGAGQLAPTNIQVTSNVTIEVPFGTTAEQAERIASYVRPVVEKELESAARKVAADAETK